MRAIILAAGFGTRLKPVTDLMPKCLVPIHGKPLLGYWFDLLLNDGVDKVLINTHYLSDLVNDYVNNSPWFKSINLVHEEYLLGTGGTILKNRSFAGENSLLVAHADNLTRFNVSDFIAAHVNRSKDSVITMMTFDTDVPKNCGIVKLDERGVVQEFHEKVANPPGTRANAAVYIIEPVVIEFIASLGKEICDFSTEVLPNLYIKCY